MPASPMSDYLAALPRHLRTGDASESTHYRALEAFLEALRPGADAVPHPKGRECGSPDLIVRKRDLIIGCIEAKDAGGDLDKAEESEQLRDR